MADYTEKATLLLIDRSSANINKINAALRKLRKEADATGKALNRMAPTGAATKISALAKSVNQLARASAKLKRVNLNVQIRGASVNNVRAMARALAMYKSSAKGVNTILGVGGRSSNFRNLDTLISKLARVARSASMAANQMARLKANIPTGRMGGMGAMGSGRNGNYAFPRNIGLEIQPLKSFWRSAVVSLGHTIFNSIRDAFAEGVKGFDVAANKMAQQRLNADQTKQFQDAAFEGGRRFPSFRPDQRMDFYAEVATNFRDPTDALKYDQAIERAIAIAQQQGESADESIEGLTQFFRGLGQAGYLQDQQGNFNNEVFKYIDSYVAAKVSEGAQINWRDAFQFLKYAKTTGQTISPDEFFYQLLAAADVGSSTAGVQANMLAKTFAGETTKKALAAQEEGGLRGPGRMVKSGAVGGSQTSSYEGGALVDEELFRENARQWIARHIIGPNGFLAKQGIDLATASPAQVIKALDPLSGNRNADDALAKAVLQFQEAAIKFQKYKENPLSDDELATISMNSSWVQLQETSAQLVTTFGLLGDKLEGPIIKAIDTVGNMAQSATDFLQGKSRGEVQDYALLAGAGAGAVGGGLLMTKILGGIYALTTAGPALNIAAANLTSAAVALGGPAAAAGGTGRNNGKAGWAALLGPIGAILAAGAAQTGSAANNPYLNLDDKGRQGARNTARGYSAAQELGPDMQEKSIKLAEAINALAVAKKTLDYANEVGISKSSDYYLEAEAQAIHAQTNIESLQASIMDGSAQILAAFEGGATRIEGASGEFGDQAAQRILGVASSFGSAAGSAIRAAIGDLSVTLRQGAALAPNTGTNSNLANGG